MAYMGTIVTALLAYEFALGLIRSSSTVVLFNLLLHELLSLVQILFFAILSVVR